MLSHHGTSNRIYNLQLFSFITCKRCLAEVFYSISCLWWCYLISTGIWNTVGAWTTETNTRSTAIPISPVLILNHSSGKLIWDSGERGCWVRSNEMFWQKVKGKWKKTSGNWGWMKYDRQVKWNRRRTQAQRSQAVKHRRDKRFPKMFRWWKLQRKKCRCAPTASFDSSLSLSRFQWAAFWKID